MRILIVDPEPYRLRQLRVILASLGRRLHNVHNAPNVMAAAALLTKRSYDRVIMHLDRSADADLELVRYIRARAQLPTGIIVYGPPPTKAQVQDALRAGASGFLVYPFTQGDVESVVCQSGGVRRGNAGPIL